MKAIPRTSRRLLALSAATLGVACATFSSQPRLSAEHLAAVREDSASFLAIVSQFVRQKTDTGGRFTETSVDLNPDAEASAFRAVAGGSRGGGADPRIITDDSTTLRAIVQQRKRALASLKLAEGKPARYDRCGGTLAEPPPPAPPGEPPRPGYFELRSGCPKSGSTYVTVSRPIPGEPDGIKKIDRDTTKLKGEIWTVIVGRRYAGPGGQNWFLQAEILSRESSNWPLKVARSVLLAWAE